MNLKHGLVKLWSNPLCRHVGIGISIILTMWGLGWSFCFNVDDSLSHSFFLVQLNPHVIPRDSYVIFDHTILGQQRRLVKKVVGIAQDEIQVKQDEVWVNEKRIGKIKPYSKEGLSLSRIAPGIIPEGFIFAAGTHKDSFDSRYENFGLVQKSQILARAYPVF